MTATRLVDGNNLPPEISLSLRGVVVTCRADQVASDQKGITLRRLKSGKLSKDEKQKARYAIMQAALQSEHPGVSVAFEHVSLLTGEQREATCSPKKLASELAKLERAFEDIRSGHFDPLPSDFKCPRCPYYFICPSHGITGPKS